MDVSVIIPTHGRPQRLSACLSCLAGQTLAPDRFEVLVGFDGPDPEGAAHAIEAWSSADGQQQLRLMDCPREGYNAVRNHLLGEATGQVLVSLNDDVEPVQDFLETHLREQTLASDRGQPAIVVGQSPWKVHQPDRLFDRLIRETSMVFFYDRMDEAEPMRDWGYRHAWGLNCSMPLELVQQVGGWTAFPLAYGYDDVEIAFRLRAQAPMPVLYRPAALAPHDHRYEPEDYLEREFRLGHSAWHFAEQRPAFARDLFGRDIRSSDEIRYSIEFLRREAGAATSVQESFCALADMPAGAIQGADARVIIEMLYAHHLPLKRWMWRAGLLGAAEGAAVSDMHLPSQRAA